MLIFMLLVPLSTQTHWNAVSSVATEKRSAAPWWWWCRKPPDTLRCPACSVMAGGRGCDLCGDTACVWLLLLRRLCVVARSLRTDRRFQSAQRRKLKYSGGGLRTTVVLPLCSGREIAWNGFWDFVDLLIWCRLQRSSLFLSFLFLLGSVSLFYLFFILFLLSHFRKPTVSFSHSFLWPHYSVLA
jgi:hypothetical protein